ncbi:MAG TPA: hypothetical protein VGF55_11115 [Gemmataceae bacterium]|jgi:hypothetical protein
MVRHVPGRLGGWVVAAMLAWGACGCSPATGSIAGKVTVGGKPVQSGNVSFVSKAGMVYTGGIGADSSYQVDGVPPGEMTVLVIGPPPPQRPPAEIGMGRKMASVTAPPPPTGGPTVDPKYGDAATSGLRYMVNPGPNTYDIPLK